MESKKSYPIYLSNNKPETLTLEITPSGRLVAASNGELLGYADDDLKGQELLLEGSKSKLVPEELQEKYRKDLMLLVTKGLDGYREEYEEFKIEGPREITLMDKEGQRSRMIIESIIQESENRIKLVLKPDPKYNQMEESIRLAQSMQTLGALAAEIGHDFKNILSIIIGNTELALEDLVTGSASEIRENLNEIITSVKRAQDLINRLNSFVNNEKVEFKPADIAQVIKDFPTTWLRSIFEHTDYKLHLIHEALYEVNLNQTQITQLLLNLFTNAAQAMENKEKRGTVKVTVSNIEVANAEGKYKPGKYVKLIVRDTGKGMSARTMERIFEPFFTTKAITANQGMGLGLDTVKKIVDAHQGYIKVNSREGVGNMFTILFPAHEATEETEIVGEIPHINPVAVAAA